MPSFNPLISGWIQSQPNSSQALSPEEQLQLQIQQSLQAAARNQPPQDAPSPSLSAAPSPDPSPTPSPNADLDRAPAASLPSAQERLKAMLPQLQATRSQMKPGGKVNTDLMNIVGQLKNEDLKSTNLLFTPDQIQEMTDNATKSPGIQGQQEGIDQLQALLKQRLGDSAQVDLSPTLAYADSLNPGMHLDSAYKRPETDDQRYSELMNNLEAVQGKRKQMADDINNFVKNEKGGVETQKLFDLLSLNSQQGQKPFRPLSNGINGKTFGNDMEKVYSVFNKDTKDNQDALQAAQQARDLLAQGTTPSDQSMKQVLARAFVHQRLTNQEINSISGDSRLIEKIKQAENWALGSGDFTDINASEMSQIIDGLEKLNTTRIQNQIGTHSQAAILAHPELNSGTVSKFLSQRVGLIPPDPSNPKNKGSYRGVPTSTAISKPGAPSSGGILSPADFMKMKGWN